MPDYNKAKIYELVCNNTGLKYYGSTVQPLYKRLSGHVDYLKKNHYVTSAEIIKGGNYYINLVENFSCSSKEELHARERWYIQNNDCVNKIIPTRTPKQYMEDNKDIIAKKAKQYREDNKEYFKKYKTEYRDKNKDIIAKKHKEYYEINKDIIAKKEKQYRENNKDIIAKKDKDYYDNNKDIIAKKAKQYRENNKDIIAKKNKEYYLRKKQEKLESILN